MAANPKKKAEAERRARQIYRRMMALRDELRPGMSNNEWTKAANVSTSFFTNMQGTTKPASEPSIGNLRAVLEAVGSSLSEFFLDEADGRLVRAPTQADLERAIADAWDDLPRQQEARIAYLATVVRQLLGLPEQHPAGEDAPAVAPPARRAAKRASRR